MKEVSSLVMFIAIMATVLGCSPSAALAYEPEFYGEGGRCYYNYYPEETITLKAQGRCAPDSVAAPMPDYWRSRYHYYYSSPSYYDYYVPREHHTVYRERIVVYERDNKTDIQKESANAKLKGSDGKVYDGKTVKPEQIQKQAPVSGTSAGGGRQNPVVNTQSNPQNNSQPTVRPVTQPNNQPAARPANPPAVQQPAVAPNTGSRSSAPAQQPAAAPANTGSRSSAPAAAPSGSSNTTNSNTGSRR